MAPLAARAVQYKGGIIAQYVPLERHQPRFGQVGADVANDEGAQAWVLNSQAVQLLEAGQTLPGARRPGQDDLAPGAGLEIMGRAAGRICIDVILLRLPPQPVDLQRPICQRRQITLKQGQVPTPLLPAPRSRARSGSTI